LIFLPFVYRKKSPCIVNDLGDLQAGTAGETDALRGTENRE
jgi:hypothetical protein